MRNRPIETLIIGCGIALGVLLVQALTQDAPALTQLLALLAAGLVLFCAQLALALRRLARSWRARATLGSEVEPPSPSRVRWR